MIIIKIGKLFTGSSLIVAVAHDEFKKMGFEYIGKFMNAKPVLIDVRGIFDGEEAKRKGFYCRGL